MEDFDDILSREIGTHCAYCHALIAPDATCWVRVSRTALATYTKIFCNDCIAGPERELRQMTHENKRWLVREAGKQ